MCECLLEAAVAPEAKGVEAVHMRRPVLLRALITIKRTCKGGTLRRQEAGERKKR
jgi:hypothetical protein